MHCFTATDDLWQVVADSGLGTCGSFRSQLHGDTQGGEAHFTARIERTGSTRMWTGGGMDGSAVMCVTYGAAGAVEAATILGYSANATGAYTYFMDYVDDGC